MFRDFCFTGQSDISTYLLENLGLFRWRSSLPVFTQMPILGFAWLVNSKPGQTGIAYGLLLSQPNFNTKQSWGDNIKCKALPVICNFIMTHLDEIWKTTSTFFKWKTIWNFSSSSNGRQPQFCYRKQLSWFLVCNIVSTQLDEIWKMTSFFYNRRWPQFFENGRVLIFFLNARLTQYLDNGRHPKILEDLIFFLNGRVAQMEDNLNSF